MKFRVYVLLILLGVTGGCALSPQVVNIRPPITVTAADSGVVKGELALDVSDGRDSPILGHRGGVYSETATISTREDITGELEQILSLALERMGYRVTDSAPVLNVTVTALDYSVRKEKVTRTVRIHASVDASFGIDRRTYTNTYRITRTREMLTAPDAAENETLINETLAAALQRMLRDEKLLSLIERGRQDSAE